METFRGLPGAKADARDVFALGAGRMEREGAAIAGDEVARIDHAADFELKSIQRGVHVASGGAGDALLAEHVPGLEGLSDFELDIASGHLAEERKTKFKMGREPIGL